MRRTIDNGFELTGPIARGDWATVEAHLAAIHAVRAASSRSCTGRWRAPTGHEDRPHRRRTARDARAVCVARSTIALVPTMGALHEGHVALFDAARRAADVVVASVFVNPTQFGDPQDFSQLSARRSEGRERRLGRRRRRRLCAAGRRAVSGGFCARGSTSTEPRRARGRIPARAFPRCRDGLPEALHASRRISRFSGRRTRNRLPSSGRSSAI